MNKWCVTRHCAKSMWKGGLEAVKAPGEFEGFPVSSPQMQILAESWLGSCIYGLGMSLTALSLSFPLPQPDWCKPFSLCPQGRVLG